MNLSVNQHVACPQGQTSSEFRALLCSLVPLGCCRKGITADSCRHEAPLLPFGLFGCSVVSDPLTPQIVAHQAPLSMGFTRQEYWSGKLFPSSGDLPDPGIKPGPPASQADSLPSELPQKLRRSTSVQFSHSVLSNSLRPHESQHARPPCPSQLLEFTQTHVHRVSDAIQPSHPLSSPSPPAPNPSQHQSFPMNQLFP